MTHQPVTDIRQLWSLDELCQRAGITRSGLRWLRDSRSGPPFIRVGRRLFVDPVQGEKWINSRAVSVV